MSAAVQVQQFLMMAEQRVKAFGERFTFPMKAEEGLSRDTELFVAFALAGCFVHALAVRRARSLLLSLVLMLGLAARGINAVPTVHKKQYSAFFDSIPLWYLGLHAVIIYLSDITATLVYNIKNFIVAGVVSVAVAITVSTSVDLGLASSHLLSFLPKPTALVVLGVPLFDIVFYWIAIQGAFTAGRRLARCFWSSPRWWLMPVFLAMELVFMFLIFTGLSIGTIAIQKATEVSETLLLNTLAAGLLLVCGIMIGRAKTGDEEDFLGVGSSRFLCFLLRILPSLMVAMITTAGSMLVRLACMSPEPKSALNTRCQTGELRQIAVVICFFACVISGFPAFTAKLTSTRPAAATRPSPKQQKVASSSPVAASSAPAPQVMKSVPSENNKSSTLEKRKKAK